jgi:DNA-binding transcriptional LysR family regulator
VSEPIETAELLAFAKTVEAKSLSRAAAELGIPRATISRRLARLEERLGVRLLRRTTRSLALTEAGTGFYQHARRVLDAVAHAEESVHVSDDVLRGPLRLAVPPITSPTFAAMLCEFAAQHPQVRLHVSFAARRVDLIREGYDVALRAGDDLEPGLVARMLRHDTSMAVASPAYLAEHGKPRNVRELRAHRCLLSTSRDDLPQTHWPLAGGRKVHVEGVFFTNDILLLCAAAARGLGIALLPMIVVGPLVESGQLVPVLKGKLGSDVRVAVVYPERDLMPPQARAMVETLLAWGEHDLDDRSMTPILEQLAKCEVAAASQPKRKPARPKRTKKA